MVCSLEKPSRSHELSQVSTLSRINPPLESARNTETQAQYQPHNCCYSGSQNTLLAPLFTSSTATPASAGILRAYHRLTPPLERNTKDWMYSIKTGT